jgi:hypothetical protein
MEKQALEILHLIQITFKKLLAAGADLASPGSQKCNTLAAGADLQSLPFARLQSVPFARLQSVSFALK